ncbi:MAG: CvpA family protein [Firmicutes bacterium]|nr:CvpA family protein [Bacillota bacterium]
MIFDIIVIAILVAAMVLGFRSGFVYTFIHTIGWFLAVLIGFIWSPQARDFIILHTEIYDSLYDTFFNKFSDSFTVADDTVAQLPAIIEKAVRSTETNFISAAADTMAGLCITVISFLAVLITVKIILWAVTEILSKKRNDGFTGAVDGLLGLAAGMIRGFLVVFFVLAILVPVSSFVSPETASSISESLNNSVFAKDLYNNNLIMLVVRDLIP